MQPDHIGIVELSTEQQHTVCGGDWWEIEMGFLVTTAFLAGALATPALLGVSAMTGGALLATEYLIDASWNWY